MKLVLYLSLFLLLSGCVSSRKHLYRAEYDSAISKSVKKLRKNPSNTKEIEVLKEAYSKANQRDQDRIISYRNSNEDNVWEYIFNHYRRLKNRQELLKTLPDKVLSDIQFIPVNYDQEMNDAKRNAAQYYYDQASELLAKDDRHSARKAYYTLQKIKPLYKEYKDTDQMIQEALYKGTNNIIFVIKNQTQIILPRDFEEELLKISLKDLNTLFLNYDTRANKNTPYDYSIILKINSISVSPESIKEESYIMEKEVEDGFRYQLDAKGNVMKDTLGNDIKIPVIKIITCKVIETQQLKSALLTGTLDYFDNRTQQLIKTNPVRSEFFFDHLAAVAIGNMDALDSETRKMVGRSPLPFPSDPEMIMSAGRILKEMVKDIIWENKNLLAP